MSFFAQPGYGYEGALYGYPGFDGGTTLYFPASNSYELYALQSLNAQLAGLQYMQSTFPQYL